MIFPANWLTLNQEPCLCRDSELLNRREQRACLFEHVYPPTRDPPGSLILYPSSWSVETPTLLCSGSSRLQRCEFLPVHLGEPGGGVSQDLKPILFSLVPKSLRGKSRPRWQAGCACPALSTPHMAWPSFQGGTSVDPRTLGP